MLFEKGSLTLLDGAMGTMLQSAGLKPGQLPELLNLTQPRLIEDIHRAYVNAGSRILYANTFGANPRKLARTGHSAEEVIYAGVAAARRAAGDSGALVALDIGPLGELLQPMGTLAFEDAVSAFARMAVAGEKAGCDLAVIETMTDLQEARAALLAVKENPRLPVLVTMSFEANGRTFTGCGAEAMARTLEGLGADALGINCSLGPAEMAATVETICRSTRLPVAVKPNAGLPDPADGHYSMTPEAFAEAMRPILRMGVSLVGGCCGTNPDFIRALDKAVRETEAEKDSLRAIPYEAVSFACSATRAVRIDRVRVIGERVNPTGKKRFQQALREEDMDYVVSVAASEADAGAELLDINVGMPGVDEKRLLPMAAQAVQAAVDLPLQIDSTDIAAVEAALRVTCGKAVVNSVTADPASLARVLPVVKKYGASVVGLTLDENGLPKTAAERVAMARRILEAARAAGIPREDVWIDCLTLTVSAEPEQAEETLAAVRAVREELGLQTVLGVSNISFGLPNRVGITRAFLLRALDRGLTLPILNPNQREVMEAVAAYRALHGEDERCARWIADFGEETAHTALPAKETQRPAASASAAATLEEAVYRGLKGEAAALARESLAATPEMELIDSQLIPALDRVGADYEAGRLYLPQLMAAAQAAQAVFEVIRSRMDAGHAGQLARGRIVMATVRGDIHDIGKNIVKTVLENYGWQVTDLGRDVPPERVRQAVEETGARLVGLSALMTTTLPAMEETVRLLQAMANPPEIMLGGAVVTRAWAESLGAHYAKDAREAAKVAGELLSSL